MSLRDLFRGVRLLLGTLCMLSVFVACNDGSDSHSNSATNPELVAHSVSVSVDEDTSATGELRVTDSSGSAIAYAIRSQPMHGSVVLSGSGPLFTYTPDANFSGSDQFTFDASNGRVSSSIATVTIAVIPVNDPPQIDGITGPDSVDARSTVTLSVTFSDIDSPGVFIDTVRQTAGTPSPPVSRIARNTVTVIAPNSQSVEEAAFSIGVRDNRGALSTREYRFAVRPVSPSRLVTTIRGSPAADGLHLVITGDGYTQAQQDQLLRDATDIANFVIDTPELQPYSNIWSAHVMYAISNESGVDIPAQGIARDTAFDGTVGCSPSMRVLCVDTFEVVSSVFTEVPAYTAIVVVSNTDVYAGGGGTVATTTRSDGSREIVLHELGHVFARLADEYIESPPPAEPPLNYTEDRFPNITAITDTSLVKWRHWFDDPNNVPRTEESGVGLFEGALFRPTGYYRPTFNSFMRSNGQPMGPVNAEAWVLSIYQRTGPVVSVQPQSEAISSPSGTPVSFGVNPRFAPPLQRIRWFENGNEVSTAIDHSNYLCCTVLSGSVTLTVRVTDASGLVRAPLPASAAAHFERTWQVQFN